MRRIKFCLFVLFFIFEVSAVLNAQQRMAAPNNPNAVASAGQAEIIINTESADRDIVVWVNGVVVAHIPPKSREKIIVHNGNNVVELADSTPRGNSWNIGNKKSVTVSANSNSTTIGFTVRYGAIVNVSIQGTNAMGSSGGLAAAPPPPPSAPAPAPSAPALSRPPLIPIPGRNASPLENALARAANVVIESIQQGTTVAVLSMASRDPSESEFAIDELTFFLVNTGKFKVVDRRSLDAIQAEAKFQYSGDVDDNSAVSIGKLLGANIVITGSISGSGSTRRLRAKALNVQTAEIMAMASEAF